MAQARTREALESVVQDATNWITELDAKTGLTTVVIMYTNLKSALERFHERFTHRGFCAYDIE